MTIPFIHKAQRSLLVGLGVLLAVVSTLAVAIPAQPASAAGCRYYWTSTPVWNIAPANGEFGDWTFSSTKPHLPAQAAVISTSHEVVFAPLTAAIRVVLILESVT